MKQPFTKTIVISGALFASMNAMATGPLEHLSQASSNSVQAIGHASVAGVKLVSGAVATPLLIVGEIGKVSGSVGSELMESVNTPIGEPLEISDEVFTASPSPKEAMTADGGR